MNRTTIRLRRLVLALLALAALYLVPANLFLNTPLGRWAVNRRPERLRVSWRSAWSLWPGRVDVRGLEVRGHQRSVRWRVAAERGHGVIDLAGLFARRFRVDGFRGDDVRAWVVRDPPPLQRGTTPPVRRPPPRRRGWSVELPRMELTEVRDIEYGPAHIAGRGRAEGGFSVVLGGDFRLDRSSLVMQGARLDQAGKPLVRDVELRAAVEMGPYVPRLHPGMEGWDFLSGSLQAQGRVPDPPLLNRLGNAATREGRLTVDIRAEHGRLLPGSRMALAPRTGRGEAPLRLSGSVASGPAGPVLFLTLQAAGLSLPAGPGQPPFLEVDALDLAGSTSEVRLRRIFSAAREIQTSRPLPDRLIGDLRARGVRLDVKGTRLACRMVLDQAQGKIDLPALLKRRLALADLQAQGGTVSLGLAPPSRATSSGTGPPWAVDLAVARLAGLREVGFDPFVLVGDTTVDLSFLLEPDGPMSVTGVALTTKPGARLQAGGETVARDIRIEARGRLDPLVLAEMPGAQALRFVSGDVDLAGRISSLGFLANWFRATPWLGVQGKGDLALGLRVERGKLVSGTRVALRAAQIEARVLDSLVTGVAAVNGSVEAGREGPDGRLVVRFDRFGLQSLRLRGRPAYLRGRGLVLNVTSRSSVDLTAPIGDLRAVVDMPSAEVPDLRVFNPYLPPGAGLAVLSGRGRASLHWDLDGAARSGRGEARLLSDGARMRFQDLEIGGRFALHMPLVSRDLESRRFELGGTELSLAGISYGSTGSMGNGQGETQAAPADWWARIELAQGSVVWDEPLQLRGSGTMAMKNADPLVLLLAPRRQFLRWFQRALGVENIVGRGSFVLAGDAFEVPALQAAGGPLGLRARMRFSQSRRRADLLLEYGGLVAGIELRDGQRSFKLLGAREWYEGGGTAPGK